MDIYLFYFDILWVLVFCWGVFIFISLLGVRLDFFEEGYVCLCYRMSGLTVPLASCLFIFFLNPFLKPRGIIHLSVHLISFNNMSLSDDWHWSGLQ